MILRSIRHVHFRGAADRTFPDLPAEGLVGTSDAERFVLSDALRFAFLGRCGESRPALEGDAGYAFVETAFRTAADARVSLFRGVDRRGASQVSLREDGGLRMTSGEEDVRARLEELLGAPLERWEQATWIDGAGPSFETLPRAAAIAGENGHAGPEAAAVEVSSGPARERAERAVESLRRALRSESLAMRLDADFAALSDCGARLRHERNRLGLEIDRLVTERDRARARLRRIDEYRELVATNHPEPAPAPRPDAPAAPGRAGDFAATACAAGAALLLFALIELRMTARSAAEPERTIATVLALAFLGALAGYVRCSCGRTRQGTPAMPAPTEDPAGAGHPWKQALRQRFGDLGDPDDPALAEELRARVAALDADLAPRQRFVEQVDEAIAACDVESGRASRSAHRPAPARSEGAQGLEPGENPADLRARIARLGDAVHHAAVERDALTAGGSETTPAAAESVRQALLGLGGHCGQAERARAALARAGLLAAAPDGATLARDEDLCLRLAEEIVAIARGNVPTSPEVPAPRPADDCSNGATDELAHVLGDVIVSLTGRKFVQVQSGGSLELLLQGPGDRAPVGFDALAPEARERVALAWTLRRAESALAVRGAAAPRPVVLARRPSCFRDDAELCRFVRTVLPRVAQVIVAGVGPVRSADAGAPASLARTQTGQRAGETSPQTHRS